MTRATRNRNAETANTDETPDAPADVTATEGTPETATTEGGEGGATATPVANDRGDVGVVTIRKSTRDITNVRSRTSNDPIHLAVRDAVRGEWYDIEVDNDAAKIERVARKLRAAAQKYDVGMNIHPEHVPSDTEGKVLVAFRTGERDKRAKPATDTTADTTTNEGDSASTPAE
jgi:hypothetical protein